MQPANAITITHREERSSSPVVGLLKAFSTIMGMDTSISSRTSTPRLSSRMIFSLLTINPHSMYRNSSSWVSIILVTMSVIARPF